MIFFPTDLEQWVTSNAASIITTGRASEGNFLEGCNSQMQNIFGIPSYCVSSFGTGFEAVLAFYRENLLNLLPGETVKDSKSIVVFQSNGFYGNVQLARQFGYDVAYVECDRDKDILNMKGQALRDTLHYLRGKGYENIIVCVTHIGGWVNTQMNEGS